MEWLEWGRQPLPCRCIIQTMINSKVVASFQSESIPEDGLVGLQAQLLSSMLPDEKTPNNIYSVRDGILRIRNVVGIKRVLVVLDDVDHIDQLDALLGDRDWYLPGSKIIITTRQKQLLQRYQGDEVLEVETLDEEDSLKLFSFHAFGQDYPPAGYRAHSRRLVEQCGGLPLALVVLCSSLCGQSLSTFESDIKKMKVIPHSRILDSLKTSFDSLEDEHDRRLFLHIACLFVGKDKDYVSKILDECDFKTTVGIQNLIDRSLLSIDLDNKLRMHQLLQDMGREIIRQETRKEPGRCSIVRCHKDALDVVTEGTGTEAIEGLILDFHVTGGEKPVETNDSKCLFFCLPMSAVVKSSSTSDKNVLQTDAFSRMYRLRLLQLNDVHLTGDRAKFPRGLVWLCWRGIPLKSLPADFPMENLVVLDMRYSSLKQVWKKTKHLPRLRILNLSHSHGLTRCPDFKALPNLERDCINLFEVHKSIMGLGRLHLLNLKGCIKLRKLPRQIHQLESLEKLDLSGCSNLEKMPEKLKDGDL